MCTVAYVLYCTVPAEESTWQSRGGSSWSSQLSKYWYTYLAPTVYLQQRESLLRIALQALRKYQSLQVKLVHVQCTVLYRYPSQATFNLIHLLVRSTVDQTVSVLYSRYSTVTVYVRCTVCCGTTYYTVLYGVNNQCTNSAVHYKVSSLEYNSYACLEQ